MNGETHLLCRIVASARKALKQNGEIAFTPARYEGEITFRCLPRGALPLPTAKSVEEWFELCKKRKVADVRLQRFRSARRIFAGFSNSGELGVACIYEKGKQTILIPEWKFCSERNQWKIRFTEQRSGRQGTERERCGDNTPSFCEVLTKIKALAVKIGENPFAECFQRAYDILEGKEQIAYDGYGLPLPDLPEKNLRLFKAADAADVFGAMGSWNDDPAGLSIEMGFAAEYEELSEQLFREICLALLYAVNEW